MQAFGVASWRCHRSGGHVPETAPVLWILSRRSGAVGWRKEGARWDPGFPPHQKRRVGRAASKTGSSSGEEPPPLLFTL
ncbi:hypothetical protein MTO96_004256 [Rhipicephalus appendiculatus]